MVDLKNLTALTKQLDNVEFSKEFIKEKDESDLLQMKAFQIMIDNMDNYVVVVTPDLKVSFVNIKIKNMLKDRLNIDVQIGESAYKQLYGLDSPPIWDPFLPAFKHKRVTIREFISPVTKRKYGIIAIPMIYNGVSAVVGIATDEDEL